MVEDRITDGTRIAQLLASELSGRDTGPLAAVSVSDADPDATPSPEGTEAYAVTADGQRVGRVVLYPDYAALHVRGGSDLASVGATRERADEAGLSTSKTDDTVVVDVESGAAVKRAVDALVAGLPDSAE